MYAYICIYIYISSILCVCVCVYIYIYMERISQLWASRTNVGSVVACERPSRRLMRRPSREAQRSCLSFFFDGCARRVTSWCAGMKPHHAHTQPQTHTHTHTQSHTHTQTDTFPFIFIAVHNSTQSWHIRMYVCMFIYMYVYTYIYIHTYIHI
jgi:hypothetical protein